MLTVSDQYKTEMKNLIRPQPFVKVVYGFVNNEAHKSASVNLNTSIDILEQYGTVPKDVIAFPKKFKSLASFEQDRMKIGNDMYIYDDADEIAYDIPSVLSSIDIKKHDTISPALALPAFKNVGVAG